MSKIKTCAIIGVKNTIYCPFEVNDNKEISKHFDKLSLYFLRSSKHKELPKYNAKIKVFKTNLSYAFLIRLIFFSKNFYKSIKLILLSNDALLERIKQIILLPKALLISEKINQNPPDLIHLFWGHYPSLVLLNLKKNINTKISIFLGAYDFRKKLTISKIASKRANFVFTHSKKRVNEIKKFLGTKTKIVCNYRGININEFKNISENKKKYTFCTVSSLEKHKNVESVIYNFEKIKKKYNKSKLYIIGKGSLEKHLKQIVKNLKLDASVNFLGWLPKGDLYKILCQSQFYLHFSKVDVIPNSIKEAMYSRCFVLSSKTFAVEEIIDHEKNGFIINPNNANNILKVIDFCLNSELSKNITKNARITIKQKFDLEKNINFFIKHFLF
ncbi:glycosyltransferase [Candidatus Pelagibacter sp. HIMB1623]|uniref:glycosyltransferase n=1 Tax=Candidatus Pelagibacter sp. HIMB1623 TaxID=3413358 RepID=UPI003F84A182